MAKLVNCPTCENPTSENASSCPSCGEPLEAGWAVLVSQQILEEEAYRAEKSAEAKKRKRSSQRRVLMFNLGLVGAVFITVYGYIQYPVYEGYIQSVIDPDGYKARIIGLENDVSKVPSSNIDENIRLYEELLRINPSSTKYLNKIDYYKNQKKEYIAAATKKAEEDKKLADKQKQKDIWCIAAFSNAKDLAETNGDISRRRKLNTVQSKFILKYPVGYIRTNKIDDAKSRLKLRALESVFNSNSSMPGNEGELYLEKELEKCGWQ